MDPLDTLAEAAVQSEPASDDPQASLPSIEEGTDTGGEQEDDDTPGAKLRAIVSQVAQYVTHLEDAGSHLPLYLLFFHMEVQLITLRGAYANLDIIRRELTRRKIDNCTESSLTPLLEKCRELMSMLNLKDPLPRSQDQSQDPDLGESQ